MFTIGVDHFDPPNQELGTDNNPKPGGKIFEYPDFYTPSVQVHRGDLLDFRVAIPDHLIQVATNEGAARSQFPLFFPDEESAIGSGGPKVLLGPAVLANFGPFQTCGGAPPPHNGLNPPHGPVPTTITHLTNSVSLVCLILEAGPPLPPLFSSLPRMF